MGKSRRGASILTLLSTWLAAAVIACGQAEDAPSAEEVTGGSDRDGGASELVSLPALSKYLEPWTGDLDGMIERGFIRALVVHNRTNYFLDGAEERGITFEALKLFEEALNERLGRREVPVRVVPIAVQRDLILPWIAEGRGDIAAANLTITPDRLARVDFSRPLLSAVREVVVTGPAGPELRTLEDLSGQEVHVRASSSFAEHLQRLNDRFSAEGREPVRIVAADELLETEDLLELASVGVIPTTIADDYMAELWSRVLDSLTVHGELGVNSDGEIGWAFRKNSPRLREVVDEFARQHGKGTYLGNVLFRRYLENAEYIRNPVASEDRVRFAAAREFFRQYGERYDLPQLLVAAQAYQESRIDQDVRSAAGAVGVMQILPSTAADPAVGIPNIEEMDSNIHAGVRYLRFLIDEYFDDPAITPRNRYMFALAAYNAGPNRIARLRDVTAQAGFDPNEWFGNLEVIVAREVGREPVNYVANIYKYYIAYRLLMEQEAGGT